MANRYANLEGSKKISEDFLNINVGFDRVQGEMDTKGTPADAQAKADAAKAAAIATAAEALAAHKARGADEHPTAKGNAAGFMSAADKLLVDARTSAATPDTLMQRDAEGRAKVAAPAAADDIARKAETDAVQTKLDTHAADTVKHVTQAEHDKLTGIAAGAEVNQNAFSKINDVSAGSKTDTVTLVGGTGITITTDPANKRVSITATGEATPGPHALSHIQGGTDVIPDAETGGVSGLMSGADAKFVRQDGESKTGAQAKADAAEQAANEYTDQKVAEVSAEVNQVLTDANEYTDERISIVTANYIRQPGYAVTSGTATAYVVTLDPVPTSLPAGFGITIVPHVASGVAPTLNVNGLGAVALKKQDGTAYAAGDLLAGKPYSFRRVGSDFLADSGGGEVEIPGQTEMTVTYGEDIAQGDMVRIYTEPNYRLPDLSDRPSAGVAVLAISSDDNYLVVSPSASPFYAFYKRSGDTFVKLPNPSIPSPSAATSMRFSPDGVYLYIGLSISPFLMVFKRSGDTFTKLADPTILPPDLVSSIKISNDGIYVSMTCRSAPYVIFYKRSGDTFVKLSDPSILPPVYSAYADLSDDGKYYAWTSHSGSTTTRLMLYERVGDTFVKLPDPSEMPTTGVRGVSFAPGAKYLTMGHSVLPYLLTYQRVASEFIKMDSMQDNLSGLPNDLSYYDNGSKLMVWLVDRPYLVPLKAGKVMYKLTAWDAPLASINTFAVGKEFIVLGKFGVPFLELYKIRKPTVRKINNISALMSFNDVDVIGYAKESGAAGDSRKIIALIQ